MRIPIQTDAITRRQVADLTKIEGKLAPSQLFRTRMPHVSSDLLSGGRYAQSIALRKKKDETEGDDCVKNCQNNKPDGLGFPGRLDWDVACIDYCNCLKTDNPKSQCEDEFRDTTGQNPPLVFPAPDVGRFVYTPSTRVLAV